MRFLSYVEFDQDGPFGPPPEQLRAAVAGFISDVAGQGALVDHGGLAAPGDGTYHRVADQRVSKVDGPFAEAKEVIGGYLMYDVRSRQEADEYARRFMQLHAELWDGFSGVCVTREVFKPDSVEV
jgi:hypothetical protein